jgi:hypothetical protein
MCDRVFWGSVIYDTVGGLRLLSGVDPVPRVDALDQDDHCLCNVDITATAAKAGARVIDDPFGYEWVFHASASDAQ